MGLDMDLYRYPRFKGYKPVNFNATEAYLDWLEDERGQKYTFEEWSGYKEKDLMREEDIERAKEWRKTRYWAWDDEMHYPHKMIRENVAYWRKANAIHKWFVDRVQGGKDDCEYHDEVTEDVLEELRDACKRVLESAVLVSGKVENGQQFKGGKWEPIMEDGKFIINPEACEKYLPTEGGFFFGNTGYNEWYLNDVQETYEVCCRLLRETDFETQMIYYVSSW